MRTTIHAKTHRLMKQSSARQT